MKGREGTVALIAIVLVAASVTGTVSAQEDDRSVVEYLENADLIDRILGYAKGVTGRVSNALDRTPWDPRNESEAFQKFFNGHSDEFMNYVNKRTSPKDDLVIRITYDTEDSNATFYLIGNVFDGNFTKINATDSFDKEPDEWVAWCGNSGKHSTEELKRFYNRFVEPGKTPTQAYENELKAKYFGKIKSSLLDGEQCDA